ncbi:MAG TPA: acylphosphatase [Pseudolabrys sp.]|nr:acylphosphatase [Pseudolabrys sp.]
MTDTAIRHVVIRGRVQGVGFRAFVEDEAHHRRLQGWVRNRRDSSVEAVFAGSPQAVDDMIAACRMGPPAARVDAIDAREGTADDLALRRNSGFDVLPTA